MKLGVFIMHGTFSFHFELVRQAERYISVARFMFYSLSSCAGHPPRVARGKFIGFSGLLRAGRGERSLKIQTEIDLIVVQSPYLLLISFTSHHPNMW